MQNPRPLPASPRSPSSLWLLLALALGVSCAHGSQTRPAPEPYPGPVIDMHAHLTPEPITSFNAGQQARPSGLLALAREAHVTYTGLIVMAQQGEPDKTRAKNDVLLATVGASNGHFFPIASVHPGDGEAALAELDRLAGLGVKAIKLHPNTQQFDVASPEVAAVVAKTAELGMVVLFDGFSPFDANQTGKFAKLAISNPRARLILAHLGGPKFDEMAQFGLYSQFPWYERNVWVDLSAQAHFYADSPYEEQLVWVVRKIGVDRVLFGSDFPVDTPAHAIEDVLRLGFTREEQQRLFFTNAAELFGLQAPPAGVR